MCRCRCYAGHSLCIDNTEYVSLKKKRKKREGEKGVCVGGGVRNREDKEIAEKNISRISNPEPTIIDIVEEVH